MSLSSITPYQDPAFGERPKYERGKSSSRTKEMVLQQDEIMEDAYAYDQSGEGEDGGDGAQVVDEVDDEDE